MTTRDVRQGPFPAGDASHRLVSAWLAETHGRRFELLRHFLVRFFDGDSISGSGESLKVLFGVVAVLLSVGILGIKTYIQRYNLLQSPDVSTPQFYRQGIREDLIVFIALAMALTAVLTVLRWQSLFPTLTDCLALAGLPVSARGIFVAKLAAVLIVFAAYTLAIALIPSLMFAAITAGPWQENHSLLANIAASFAALGGACAFVFFALLACQGILLNALPARLFTRISLAVQGVLFVAVIGAAPLVGRQPLSAAWWPPVWFLRLWESIAGSEQTPARLAVISIAVPAALFVLAYLASYRRYQRILLESVPGRAGSRWPGLRSWLLARFVRNPREQAAFSFIWKTLSRSPRHRLILLGYAGLALGAITKGALDMPRPSLRDEGLYGAVVVLLPLAASLLVVNALRYLFAVPESLRANWVFQIAEQINRKSWLDAVERFVMCAVAPVFVVAIPAASAVFGPVRAAAVIILDLLCALLWFEVAFRRWDQLPFTCSYIPGKRPAVLILLRYALALPLLAALGHFILRSSGELTSFLALSSFEAFVLWRCRRGRRAEWNSTPLRFEDTPPSDIAPLRFPAAARDSRLEPATAPSTTPPAMFSNTLVASRGLLPQDWAEEIADDRRRPSVLFGTTIEDVRYGLRVIRRTPALSAVIILTLTVGIGINASVFTIVNALALRPHVYTDPDSFVRVIARGQFQDNPRTVSYAEYMNWRDRSRSLRQVAAWDDFMALIGNEDAAGTIGLLVSCNFFTVDGLSHAIAGRLLHADDCSAPGQMPVVVLSESLWRSRFASDPRIEGRVVQMNGVPVTIAGVVPDGTGGWVVPRPKLWVPYTAQPYFEPGRNNFVDQESLWLRIAGRLAPGVSRSQAQSELGILARQHDVVQRGRRTVVVTTNGSWAQELELTMSGKRLMLIGFFLGAFNLVLLISCANVATLLLSRAATRQREIAVRLALGAPRIRIVRMLVTESTVLAVFAGLASAVLIRYVPEHLYRAVAAHPADFPMSADWRTFFYISAVVLLSGFLSGLAPALESLKVDVAERLKGSSGLFGSSVRGDRLRGLLVSAQVAMSMVLLVEAGMFAQSEDRTLHRDPGYSPRSVVVAPLRFTDKTSAETVRVRLHAIADRVRALPGVRSVAFSENIPLWSPETIEVRPPSRPDAVQPVDIYSASPHFFETLGIPVIRGREFLDSDVAAVVISQTVATLFWPHADPIGKELALPNGPAIVIGVVRDIEPMRFGGSDNPVAYKLRRSDQTYAMMSVRFHGGVSQGGAAIRAALSETAPGVFIIARVLQSWIEEVTAVLWNMVAFIIILGCIATVLATTGIYGAVSFAVSQRTRDIGIRLALGARRLDVIREVLLSGGRPVVHGLLVGLWMSLAAGAGLRESVEGTPVRLDTSAPFLYCAAASLLSGAALIAMWGPARRGSNCNPCDALRCD